MLENFDNVHEGTRLLIRDDLQGGEVYDEVGFAIQMEKYVGQIVVVDRINKVGHNFHFESARIQEDNGQWVWTPSMFEEIIGDQPEFTLTELLNSTENN